MIMTIIIVSIPIVLFLITLFSLKKYEDKKNDEDAFYIHLKTVQNEDTNYNHVERW